MKPRVLIVDDEDTIRKLLKSRLEREGYDTVVAGSADEAQVAFTAGGETGVVVTDIRMPGKDGFEFMAWIRSQAPQTRVVVITGHGEKTLAVKALRSGASDYLEKPFDLDELTHAVKRCMREYELERENTDLVGRLEARVERVEGKAEDKFWFVSKDPSMAKANEWLTVLRREAMRGEAEEPSVLILGESGVGKEGIARMVHAGSRRARGPWIAVNCANFSEQLLESELFGHEKGSFTGAVSMKRGLFEIAQGGTLFLDEIGEMDVKLQARLLRVLQEKTFRRVGGTVDQKTDVRIVAATNVSLQERVRAGAFREDLYHRLSRVVVDIPALRERKTDVIPMATYFAERSFRARGKSFPGFSAEADETIRTYTWPGNVREMLNVIERLALIHVGTSPITARTLGLPAASGGSGAVSGAGPRLELVSSTPDLGEDGYMGLKKRWADSFEREYLIASLAKHHGNVSAAAREAKLDRSNFLRLLRRHGLKAQPYRQPGDTAEVGGTGTDGSSNKVAA